MNNTRYLMLTNSQDQRYLFDTDAQWEIYDKGSEPAFWVNHNIGRNLDVMETFEQILSQLGLSWDEPIPAELTTEQVKAAIEKALPDLKTYISLDNGIDSYKSVYLDDLIEAVKKELSE